MAIRCWSGSGVTQFAASTAYSLGQAIVPLLSDAGANATTIGRAFVWECTTGGTTDTVNPTWPASAVPDVTTITSNTAVFTARCPGEKPHGTKDWTLATPLFAYAVAAENYNLESQILVQKTHTEELAADSTFTISNNTKVICVDKDNNDAWAEMGTGGWIGNSTTNRFITIAGAYVHSFYGITFRVSGAGDNITLISSNNQHVEYEKCLVWNDSSSGVVTIYLGGATEQNGYIKLTDCVFRFNNLINVGSSIGIGDALVEMYGCSLYPTHRVVTTLFTFQEQGAGLYMEGCDWSAQNGINKNLFGDCSQGAHTVEMRNCKIGACNIMATQTVANLGSLDLTMVNCAGADAHYAFYHENALGKTEAVTYATANDGARYDGTMRVAWKITGSNNCSFYTPYVSPWIDVYHDKTAAITPRLEVLAENSSAWTNDALWVEFSYQGTANSTLATMVNTRRGLLSSSANIPTGMGTSNWSGHYTGGAGPWSGKLEAPSAITPKAIGHIRARICLNATTSYPVLYVDPQIRGLTA